MGHSIWHSEGQTGGSTFRFRIPLDKALVAEVAPGQAHAAPGALLGMHALIVDDNYTNRRILALQCDSFGMTHAETEPPLEALRWIVDGQRFDVAILDHLMPEMDGIELAGEIRKRRNARTPKLIFLTSAGPLERAARAAALDVQNMFCKPLHLWRLS
jgi:CheY-like chemotaxis protein